MHEAIAVEVFRHRVAAVAEAMGATLQMSANSPNIKERRDYSCAVFDADGRLLAQAAHIPVHLGALPFGVAAARAALPDWRPGDVVALNDPYLGGSHLPDITTVSAVFLPGARRPALFLSTRAHHADVGGSAPGSMGLAEDLHGEGIVLPPVRVVRSGETDTDIIAILCANSRTPSERRADLQAQIGAHQVGEAGSLELLAAMPHSFDRIASALLEYSARRTRSVLRSIPAGTYRFVDVMERDRQGSGQMEIRVALSIDPTTMVADFRGTADQTTGGINAPLAVTHSAVYYVLACLLGDTPINEGAFRAVRVEAPLGSLVNPRYPAAVAAGNVETSQRIVDVLLGALAQAVPDLIPAASQGTMNNVLVGGHDPRTGVPFTYYETVGGGSGAGPLRDGAAGVQVHMTNTRNTPIEAMETEYPLRVEEYRLRSGSGGDGLHRGGEGIVRRLRFLCPARLTVVAERRAVAPWGLRGGRAGSPGSCVLSGNSQERILEAKCTLEVVEGNVLTIATPGGGGWGRPSAQDVGQKVENDEK